MKQIYMIAIFFWWFQGFSQLYIKPAGNQDSYLFVENRLLFVEKQIELNLNPSEENKASIYLRDEAQLLQGNSNSSNSGNGLISVFQEGEATTYTYNYWSAPVTDNSGSPDFGNILYEPLNKTFSKKAQITGDYDGSAKPLKISDKWIYKLSGVEYSDWEYVGKNFNVAPGEGFTMKGVNGTNTDVVLYGIANNPGNRQRYDFRGTPNNGHINVAVKRNEIVLTGNPYPSALDLNIFLTENSSSTGIAYFWDSKSVASHYVMDYEGGYGAYSPAAGNNGYVPAVFDAYDNSGVPASFTGQSGDYYARRFSPLGQGFLMEGRENGNLLFKNEYRSYKKENSETSQFKTTSISPKSTAGDISSFRINIEFNDTYVRQLLLVHRPDATSGLDYAMDAKNLSVLSSDAGWLLEDESYLIDVRPYEEKEEIPLLMEIAENSEIALIIGELVNFDKPIFLLDTETGVSHDLSEEFRISLEKGIYDKRFKITFSGTDEEISTPEATEQITDYFIFQNNYSHRLEIFSAPQTTPEWIMLFDTNGKKVKETRGVKDQGYYEILTGNLSSGIYIIKITGLKEPLVSKKVIIFN